VDVVRKPIKNVHLSVLPPAGRVRISAPERMSLDTVRVFAIAKLPWIKKQQQKLQEQERETPREYKNLPSGIKGNKGAVAETIANNVRSKIVREHLNDPAFYDQMSALLAEILADLKSMRIDYEEFLKRIADLAKQVQAGKTGDTPEKLDTPGKRALYNNLNQDEVLALKIDATVRKVRPSDFRGNQAKENIIKGALLPLMGNNRDEVERIFLIIKAQAELHRFAQERESFQRLIEALPSLLKTILQQHFWACAAVTMV
jgi:Protein of unknown function DUF45